MKKIIKNIFYLFFPLLNGSIVGLAIKNSIDYNIINKPPLSPPGIIFPIIWSIIYLLMGISFYLLKKENSLDEKGEAIYYLQLAINSLWSIIFFVWKLRLFAVIWIFLLDFFVVWLFILFYKKKKVCAYLNLPYLFWVLFATYLTIGVYILN